MAETYKRFAGFDWPVGMTDDNIRLTIAKKWREYRDRGIFEFKDPWVHLLDAAKHLFTDEYLKVSEWTEQHFHDWVMEPMLMTIGCASSGKALLPDEPVYYPDRVGTVGDVHVGDRIIDAVGGLTEVIGIREQLDEPLYRVRFVDGAEVLCSGGHLWTVQGFYYRLQPDGKRRLALAEETVPAAYLASLSPAKMKNRQYRVPLPAPVAFAPRDVPLDPYVLGCLLGDGCVTGSHVSLASAEADSDLRREFCSRLPAGYELHKTSRSPWHVEYAVVAADGRRGRNQVLAALDELGVRGRHSYEKGIPDIYKFNSVEVRLDLAAGLLDTDGWVGKDGRIGFKTTSKALAEDMRFVMESLGAYVTTHVRPAHAANVRGRRCMARESFDLLVHGLPLDVQRKLFKITRKRDRLRSRVYGVGCRHIESVELVADRSSYPRRTRCLVLASLSSCGRPSRGLFPVGRFVVTHNSNDTGAIFVLDWVTDPYDTIILVGSTTRDALRIRTWESIERYFKVLQNGPMAVPGKLVSTSCRIVNDHDLSDDPAAQGGKAGIHGVALNDGGKLQGAHLPYVRLAVDELATITNQEDIKTTIENLQIAKDFRFVGLMNPETWSNPSCQYIIPTGGVASVNVDTGSWRSTFGCFVRHHDGLKSPCVLHPELAERFPFLTQRRHIEAALKRSGGNPDTPRFWKMVRGFPMPASSEGNVILDEAVAIKNHASDPAAPFDPMTWIATCDGIDPAWTEDGDGAAHARCYIRRDPWGRPYLDFTNGVRSLTLNASEFPRHPAVEQMRNQVVARSREPYAAPFRQMAVDSSGNQGLASDLIIYAAAVDIMQVNFSTRASEAPLNAIEAGAATPQKTKDRIYDRGTEAWCVLAEFVRAGQVRGLPQTVIAALTQRRYAANMVKDASGMKHPAGVKYPLRMEDKEEFKKRYGRSPDECDACAMAALAAKERCGFVPFAYVVNLPRPELQNQEARVVVTSVTSAPKPSDDFETRFDDADDLFEPEV